MTRRDRAVVLPPCPCGGRLAIVADVTERAEIVAYLEARGLPAEAPRVARARSPTLEAA